MEELKLNNEMTVLFTPSMHQTVHIALFVKVGTKHESQFPGGIAHFIEHMLFKGTAMTDAKTLAERMDAIGGEVNAYTTKEYTCYTIKTLRRYETEAMNLLLEMMFHSNFPEDEIERERQVILEEIKMTEDDAEDDIFETLHHAAHEGSAYEMSILGTKQTLNKITRDTLIEFHQSFYQPSNMVFSYAGQDALPHIEKLKQLTNSHSVNIPQADYKFKAVQLQKVAKEMEQAHLLMSYDGVSYHHELYDAFEILSAMLGESVSSLLFSRIREELGLCYNIYTTLDSYDNGGVFSIYVGCDDSNIEAVQLEIVQQIEQFKHQLNEQLLNKAKSFIITNAYMNNDYEGHIMMRKGRSKVYYGSIISLEAFEERIQAVTVEQMKEVMGYLAQPAVMTIRN